jgi:hypothetical protein
MRAMQRHGLPKTAQAWHFLLVLAGLPWLVEQASGGMPEAVPLAHKPDSKPDLEIDLRTRRGTGPKKPQ